MGLLTISDLSGLGQTECGPKPGLGPGERAMCCPDLGWVIYDSSESGYALCERAAAKASGGSSGNGGGGSLDDELAARRQAMEERRIALEERQFQQRLQTVMLKAQLKRLAAARAASPEAVAERRAQAAARAKAAERAKAEKTKKALTYGAVALVAAKILKLF